MVVKKISDYRFIPFTSVLLYLLIFLLFQFNFGTYVEIGKLFKLHPEPYFIDLNVLLCGIEAMRNSNDPYTTFCNNTFPLFNYPYVWVIFSLLPFLNSSNLIYIGLGLFIFVFILLYFYVGKLKLYESLIYSCFFLSPSMMLGFERGNCDLIIFSLLLIPYFVKFNFYLTLFIVFFTSILKLFPIAAFISIFNSSLFKVRKYLYMLTSVLFLFALYIYLFRDNILIVSKKTPRPFGTMAYGLGGVPSMFNYFKGNEKFTFLTFLIYSTLLVILFLIYHKIYFKKYGTLLIDSNEKGFSYLMGSSIFILTCFIGFNFEYRLIFLIFTLPQILKWIDEGKFQSFILLVLSIFVMWQSLIRDVSHKIISELILIFLFLTHLNILLKFIYDYYKLFFSKNNS